MFVKQKDILRTRGVVIQPTVWDMTIKVGYTLFTIGAVVLFIYVMGWLLTVSNSTGSVMMYILDILLLIGLIIVITATEPLIQRKVKE